MPIYDNYLTLGITKNTRMHYLLNYEKKQNKCFQQKIG